jgi:hypothetical protein
MYALCNDIEHYMRDQRPHYRHMPGVCTLLPVADTHLPHRNPTVINCNIDAITLITGRPLNNQFSITKSVTSRVDV